MIHKVCDFLDDFIIRLKFVLIYAFVILCSDNMYKA